LWLIIFEKPTAAHKVSSTYRKALLWSKFQDLIIQELKEMENSSCLSSAYVSNMNPQPEGLTSHEQNNYES